MAITQIIVSNLDTQDVDDFAPKLRDSVLQFMAAQHFPETPHWTLLSSLLRIIVNFKSEKVCRSVSQFIESHYSDFKPVGDIHVETLAPRIDPTRPELPLRVNTYLEAEDEKRGKIIRRRSEEGYLSPTGYPDLVEYREPTPEKADQTTSDVLFTPTEETGRPLSPSITINRFE